MGPRRRYISLMRRKDPKEITVGISPLGGNGAEGTRAGFAPIRDTSVLYVPLFFDSRVGCYISEQGIDDLDDIDDSAQKRIEFQKEESFRARVGFRRA